MNNLMKIEGNYSKLKEIDWESNGIQNIKNYIKKVIQNQVKINNRQSKKQSSYCVAQVSPFLPALPFGNYFYYT